MNEYAVRVHAHHPYGDAMPKEQGVTASLARAALLKTGLFADALELKWNRYRTAFG